MLVAKPRYALPSFWQSPPPPPPPTPHSPFLPRAPTPTSIPILLQPNTPPYRLLRSQQLSFADSPVLQASPVCPHSWNVPWARLDPGWDPHREITPEQTPIWSRLADSAHLPLGSARQRTICGRTPVPATSYAWLSGILTWHSSRHGFISATISK